MAKRSVLLTGASGYIAAQVLPGLRARYDLRLVDARAADRNGTPVPGIRLVDLTNEDLDASRSHFRGVDTVVHLAYIHPPDGQGSAAPVSYRTEQTNVAMAFHVYQLALEEGVRRVVVASSNHAADWYEHLVHAGQKEMVDPWERPLSDNFYGWAKATYEHLGFVFASGKLGRSLEVVQIRIGAPRDLPAERYRGHPIQFKRDLGAYISERDLTQLVVRSIESGDIRDAHGIPFLIVYGISANARRFWSLASGRTVLGYEPEDDSEVCYAASVREILAPLDGPVPLRPYPAPGDDPGDPSRPGRG